MNLETRVETLEHELKILKNEIEETLLEIQNQVLIHYYPALRAEDSTPPQEILKNVARNKATTEQAAEATDSATQAGTAVGTSGVQMKEVSLHDRPTLVHTTEVPPPAQDEQSADLSINPNLLSQLSMWSTFAVERIGKAEAQQMVDSCTAAIGCTPAIKAALRQLIVLCRVDGPPPQVDTAALMDVFLKLNKLFAEVTDRAPKDDGQPVTVVSDNSDG